MTGVQTCALPISVLGTPDLLALAVEVRLQLARRPEARQLARVWRIPDLKQLLHPAGGGSHGAAMGEDVERRLATVSALSGIANTTKGKCRDGAVEERVIDSSASRKDLIQHWSSLLVHAAFLVE